MKTGPAYRKVPLEQSVATTETSAHSYLRQLEEYRQIYTGSQMDSGKIKKRSNV